MAITQQAIARVFQAISERLIGDPTRRRYELIPFFHTHNFLPAVANTVTTTQFTVQSDSAFAIFSITAVFSDTADAFVANLSDRPQLAPFLLSLNDSGSGRNLMDVETHINNIAGTGREQSLLPVPYILDPASTLQGGLRNLSAVNRNVRITYAGVKVFGDVRAFMRERI
jgi:hypothetical protein